MPSEAEDGPTDVPSSDLRKLLAQILRKLKDPAAIGALALFISAGFVARVTGEVTIVFVSAVVLGLGLMALAGFREWLATHARTVQLNTRIAGGVEGGKRKLAARKKPSRGGRVPDTKPPSP